MRGLALAVVFTLVATEWFFVSGCDSAQERNDQPRMLLHYTFDADDGTRVVDESGEGNDGTLFGATPTAGRGGGALLFNGTDAYVATGPLDQIGTAWSVALWFKSEALEDGRSLFEGNWADDFVAPSEGLTIDTGVNGGGYVGFNLGRHGALIAGTNAASWHHVAVVFDEGTATAYYDGRKSCAFGDFTSPASFSNVQIGRGTAPGVWRDVLPGYFRGQLDDIRVYDGALDWVDVGDIVFAGK